MCSIVTERESVSVNGRTLVLKLAVVVGLLALVGGDVAGLGAVFFPPEPDGVVCRAHNPR